MGISFYARCLHGECQPFAKSNFPDCGKENENESIDPGIMTDAELELELKETCPYNPEKGHVPEYKFAMVNTNTRAIIGGIRLRIGLTKTLNTYGGHIGYEVDKLYRGHRYATRSCRLLIPLIQRLEIQPVVITCTPENIPSTRTIESLGLNGWKSKMSRPNQEFFD